MTYGDLPDLSRLPSHLSQPALYCRMRCKDGSYSANRGDYFLYAGDKEIVCAECGQPMELLVARVTLEPWSPPA